MSEETVRDVVDRTSRDNYSAATRAECARCGGEGWTGPNDPRPGVTCDDCNGTGCSVTRPALTEFEARIALSEADVERVARALFWSEDAAADWSYFSDEVKAPYRRLAAAAIAALPPSPAEGAVKRVEALAEELERFGADRDRDNEDDDEAQAASAAAYLRSAGSLRAALASPAPAPQGEEGCTKRTSSAHEDEVTYECGRPATVEALTTSGQWEPHCAPHVAGWPSDRVRSR